MVKIVESCRYCSLPITDDEKWVACDHYIHLKNENGEWFEFVATSYFHEECQKKASAESPEKYFALGMEEGMELLKRKWHEAN